MLDLDAAIHHHFQAGAQCAFGCLLVDDAQLHPDYFRANRNGLFDNSRYGGGFAKDIHDFDGRRRPRRAKGSSAAKDLGARLGSPGRPDSQPPAYSVRRSGSGDKDSPIARPWRSRLYRFKMLRCCRAVVAKRVLKTGDVLPTSPLMRLAMRPAPGRDPRGYRPCLRCRPRAGPDPW